MLILDQANLQNCVQPSSRPDERLVSETLQLRQLVLTLMEKSPPDSLTSTPAQPEKWSSYMIEFLNNLPLRTPSELLQVSPIATDR